MTSRLRLAILSGAALLLVSTVHSTVPAQEAAPPTPPPWLEAVSEVLKAGDFAGGGERVRALLEGAEILDAEQAYWITGLLRLLRWSLFAQGQKLDDKARRLATTAVDHQRGLLGEEHPRVAFSLLELGILIHESGDLEAARPLLERSLEIRERVAGPDHPDTATSLFQLGYVYQDTGDFDRALEIFHRSYQIRARALGDDDVLTAESLAAGANVLVNLGDYPEALAVYRHCLEIARRTYGPEHSEVGMALYNLAAAHEAVGDLETARTRYGEALEIWRRTLTPSHPYLGFGHTGLGRVSSPSAAEPLLRRGVAILEQALGPDHPRVARALSALGVALWADGRRAEARVHLERARAILEGVFGEESLHTGEALAHLATLLPWLGERQAAFDLALRSEGISRDHLRLTIRSLAERQALSYAAVRSSGLDVALTLAAEESSPASRRAVWDAVIRSRGMVLDEMAARQRLVGAAESPEIAELSDRLAKARQTLANLFVRGPANLPAAVYRERLAEARLAKDQAEWNLAHDSRHFRESQRRSRIGLEAVAAALPEDAALLAYVRYVPSELPAAGEPAAGGPAAGEPAAGEPAAGGPAAGEPAAGEPAASISDDGDSDAAYLALVLSLGDPVPALVPLGPAAEIDPLIERWHDRTHGYSESRYRQAGARLRHAVWDPLTEHLGGARRLFVVPAGGLHLVNLAALPEGETSYLVEREPMIHHLSVERDLVATGPPSSGPESSGPESPGAESPTSGLLAVGGADFDAWSALGGAPAWDAEDAVATNQPGLAATGRPATAAPLFRGTRSGCDALAATSFAYLPATIEETREIRSLMRRVAGERTLLLTGAAASETAFKRHAGGYRLLHLATHGLFLNDRCPAAFAVDDRRETLPPGRLYPQPAHGDNPLLLSGLALAGANHRDRAAADQDDGILTAEEIATLDLSGVEWAVLSACETGAGTVLAGEGIFGLRRALRVAGVRTVILSLWRVDDDATRRWMRALYQARLERRQGTAEAVRQASLEVLRERREKGESTHPFYWGGFVAEGDWR